MVVVARHILNVFSLNYYMLYLPYAFYRLDHNKDLKLDYEGTLLTLLLPDDGSFLHLCSPNTLL